jgi:hypothetical protein
MAIKAQSYLNLYGDLSSIATAVAVHTSSLHKGDFSNGIRVQKYQNGEVGNRTPDLVHAKHALYQLSYIPFACEFVTDFSYKNHSILSFRTPRTYAGYQFGRMLGHFWDYLLSIIY